MRLWGSTFYYSAESPPQPGGRIPLDCPFCETHTDAKVISCCTTNYSKWVDLPHNGMVLLNYLVQCTRCGAGLLVFWPHGRDLHGGYTTAEKYVWPLPASDLQKAASIADVPRAVSADLQEAELAFIVGAVYGAALLLRRACQNICRERDIAEPPGLGLKGQVAQLAARGIITKALAEMADSVRVIANEVAHPSPDTPAVITVDDVAAAREFMLQLTQAVYIDPARATRLKEGLAKRGVK
jgi:hypothetical protein